MGLKEFYEGLPDKVVPKKEFREKVATACGVSEMTVFRWLSGDIIPDKLKREKIAELSGEPIEKLFPRVTEV